MPPGDVERLLRCWGIPVVASRLVASAAAAGRAAAELGGAVALKAVVPGAAHKSDAGGVRLDLAGRPPCGVPPARSPAGSKTPVHRPKGSRCSAWRRRGRS